MSNDVTRVVVHVAGSAAVVATYDTVPADGWTTARAVVASLPTGDKPLDFVGLDAAGREVATAEVPPSPPMEPIAPPDFSAVAKGPVVAKGTLDGHPWTAQAATVQFPSMGRVAGGATPQASSTSEACVVITYAGGASQPVCSNSPALLLPSQQVATAFRTVDVASARRQFVIAFVAPDVTSVRAAFAGGGTATFPVVATKGASPGNGRFAVVPVASTSTLTSVTAVRAAGDLGTVTGTVPGQPGQPWDIGGNGGDSASGYASTRAVPLTTP